MPRELSDEAVLDQLHAFLDYQSRGGRQGLSEWMTVKDFAPEDRAALVAAYTQARVLAS